MRRRDLFREAGAAGLALGLAAAGRALIALPARGSPAGGVDDLTMIDTALALEHEAIWAYGLAGSSGLLSAKAKEVGLLFQGSHEIHRDRLADAVKRKGGVPAEPKKEYVFGVPLSKRRTGARVQARRRRRAHLPLRRGPLPGPPSRARRRESSPTRSCTRRCSGAWSEGTSSRRSS